jgi:hypothetical protein
MDYLRWYRQVLQLDVRNLQRVTDLSAACRQAGGT